MSRPTHDRTDLHYGIESDLVQLLSVDIGSISVGSDLHAALEYIHNQILFFETQRVFGFQANSVIKNTASGSLSANSILRQNITGSKTADAIIKRNQTGSFTADAVIA